MKIGILTLPFVNNYGGILQNYALQKVLKKMGHNPVTLDVGIRQTPMWIFFASLIKSAILFFIPQKRRPFAKSRKNGRSAVFDEFIQSQIQTTDRLDALNAKDIVKYKLDAIIVGSDQVWRPRYALNIEDYFLGFLKNDKIRRIAYAVSFGVDFWEYLPEQTGVCAALAKKFYAVSVREESAVRLCKENFDVEAVWNLDPTLLLDKEEYCEVCEDVPMIGKNFLAAYVLNVNESILSLCKSIANDRGLELKIFSADSQATFSVPEWLGMFRDASYVVTDSFHGTVFSIIFEKEFKCIYNENRGSSRFESLMKLYQSGKLDEMRKKSLNWLEQNLES